MSLEAENAGFISMDIKGSLLLENASCFAEKL